MGKTIIVTAGPTNEHIDAVMQITNMSTGSLGACVVEAVLGRRDASSPCSEGIDKVYYLSPKLARKPIVPDGQAHKLELVRISSTQNLLDELSRLLTNPDEHIDAVVHSAAVGDYKGRYVVRAEDLAREIADAIVADPRASTKTILDVLVRPKCLQNDATKISSYEPNLMVMLDLTPKVIGHIKALSPDTMLIGFKLLENVPKQELFDVASTLRQKNKANYIVANDLALIGDGRHPAMIIGYDSIAGRDAIFAECETKDDIALEIAKLIIGNDGHGTAYNLVEAGGDE